MVRAINALHLNHSTRHGTQATCCAHNFAAAPVNILFKPLHTQKTHLSMHTCIKSICHMYTQTTPSFTHACVHACTQAISRTHVLCFGAPAYELQAFIDLPCNATFEDVLGPGILEQEPVSPGTPARCCVQSWACVCMHVCVWMHASV